MGRLAATLTQRTQELEDLLKIAEPGRGDGQGHLSLVLAEGVTKPAVRSALLKAALDVDAKLAAELAGVPDFEARVVAARTALREQVGHADGEYEDYLTPGRIEGLSLRELLLLGRVDDGGFRAQEKTDQLVRECLAEFGLLPRSEEHTSEL